MGDSEEKKKYTIDTEMLNGEENHFVLPKSAEITIARPGFVPIIDNHMHIESNNASPLSLSFGVMAFLACLGFIHYETEIKEKLPLVRFLMKYLPIFMTIFAPFLMLAFSILLKIIEDIIEDIMSNFDRKVLNEVSILAMQDFGRIGCLDTDYVANLFMGDIQKIKNMHKAIKISNKIKFVDFNKDDAVEESELRQENLKSEEHRNSYESRYYDNQFKGFAGYASYYYENVDILHMFTAMPMDMSFAHYWGFC